MSSLSPSRPLVIMVIGHPGAGKSYFARRFADTFAAPIVGVDRLRHELFPEPQFSKEEDILIARILSLEIRELLKTKKTFMIDGGVNSKAVRAEITKIAKKSDYQTMLVWVQTDKQTAMMRSVRRSADKDDDRYNRAMHRDVFSYYAEKMTPPHINENHVVISGKHTYPAQAKVVLRKLSNGAESRPAAKPPAREAAAEPKPSPAPEKQVRRVNITS